MPDSPNPLQPSVPDPQDSVPSEIASRRAALTEMLVEAVSGGLTYAEAGAFAGCSSRTARRRMAEPEVAAEVARRRDLRTAENIGLLTNLETKAIRRLGECLEHGTLAEALAAARLILTVGPRLRAAADINARLTVQEQLIARALEPTDPERCDDESEDDDED